ncbi:MAG: VPLPA-CTERM sorting domain-containing protein, partial [Pseudomonadota bacterium]
ALALALMTTNGAHAATAGGTAAFAGDICTLDIDAESGFDDCRTLLQPGADNPVGVFSLTIDELDTKAFSDATITITSSLADLFKPLGDNDAAEHFGLSIDGVSFGVLFDETKADERAINPGLADSVGANISAATASRDAISLVFTIAQADFAGLVADGSLTALFDFRTDESVGNFVDPTFSVSYAVPLPASMMLMLSGLAGLFYLGRRRIV